MNLTKIKKLGELYQKELPPLQVPEVPSDAHLASWIDHTLLKPEARPEQILQLCQEALQYGFASVCINPIFIPLAHRALAGSDIPICTVIGFPLGATPTKIKVEEAIWSMKAGAAELDMVIPIGLLKAADFRAVYDDVLAVTKAVHAKGCLVKVILEMAYLDEYEKIMACLLCKEAGSDFVKTSTGFGPSGAIEQDVHLMRAVVGSPTEMGVKAAGGIRTYADVLTMIQAGATRIGASAGVKIISEARGITE